MSAPCVACGDRIALDGYCAGCSLRAGGHVGHAERFGDRLGRGQVGYAFFILLALVLFSVGTDPANFGLGMSRTDSADRPADIPRAEWAWWALGAGAVLLTALCRGIMSAGPPSVTGRLAIWPALLVAWVFAGFLGFHAAKGCRVAFVEAGRRAESASAAGDRIDREYETLRYGYWERCRQRNKPVADAPAVDLLNRFAERDTEFDRAAKQLEEERERPGKEAEAADSLRWQCGTLFAACVAAMAAVVSLLFLVAAEQSWESEPPSRSAAMDALAVD